MSDFNERDFAYLKPGEFADGLSASDNINKDVLATINKESSVTSCPFMTQDDDGVLGGMKRNRSPQMSKLQQDRDNDDINDVRYVVQPTIVVSA